MTAPTLRPFLPDDGDMLARIFRAARAVAFHVVEAVREISVVAAKPALGQQQRGDEVTADHEEHLDPEESAGDPAPRRAEDEVVMEEEHRQDRYGPQPVEAGQVSEGGVGRRGRR